MSQLVRYGEFDLATAEQEAEELAKGSDNSEFLKIKVGKNVFRFLPPPVGVKSPFKVVHEHFFDLPGDKKAKFACPRQMTKAFCPACQKADDLRRTGDARDKNRAYNLYAKKRIYANVINRANPDLGPQILAFGKGIYDNLLTIRGDLEDGGDFTHPVNGFDIVILRKGQGKNDTEYSVKTRSPSPLGNDEWIAQQWNLDVFAKVPTLKEATDLMSGKSSKGRGREDEDDDDEDSGEWEEEAPAPNARATSRRAAPKTAEDDAFADDDDGDDIPY